MIDRCLACHSPIFHNSCLCGKNVVRCPDCTGDGRHKILELLEDTDGFLGWVLHPQKQLCSTCGGVGKVGVTYNKLDDN